MKNLLLSLVLAAVAAWLVSCGAGTAPPDKAAGPAAERAGLAAAQPSAGQAGATVSAREPSPVASTRQAKAATTPTTASAPSARQRQQRIVALNQQLDALAKAAKWAECKPLLEEILQLDPNNGIAWYNLACVDARLGEPDKAVGHLYRAIENNYSNFRHMERDEDLASLRGRSEYKKLLERNEEIQKARAGRIRDALDQRFGSDYICEIDHDRKLVFATNIDRQTLDELKTSLTEYAECQWKDLFSTRFEQYLTIVIPSPAAGRTMIPPSSGGYYNHAEHLLVALQIGMVLTHEFTHALHACDQEARGQSHPIWVLEGLATLFESTKFQNGHAVPQPNPRLNVLKDLVARKQNIPWAQFVKLSQADYVRRAMTCYPQGRYMMMYLYDKGLLKTWYDAYLAGYEADPTGAKALEEVLKKPLAEAEKDWLAWLAEAKPVPVVLPPRHAYLGVRVAGQTDGLQIAQLVPGSGADKAGLKAGDVIVRLDGARVIEAADLVATIDKRQVGDKMLVQYRRDGKYQEAPVVLEAMPESVAGVPATTSAPSTRPRPTTRPRPATTSAPSPGRFRRPPASRPARQAA